MKKPSHKKPSHRVRVRDQSEVEGKMDELLTFCESEPGGKLNADLRDWIEEVKEMATRVVQEVRLSQAGPTVRRTTLPL